MAIFDFYFPFSYSVWMSIATNKFAMTEELSWLCVVVHLPRSVAVYTFSLSFSCRYFETFDLVSEISLSDRQRFSEVMAKCSSQEEISE